MRVRFVAVARFSRFLLLVEKSKMGISQLLLSTVGNPLNR